MQSCSSLAAVSLGALALFAVQQQTQRCQVKWLGWRYQTVFPIALCDKLISSIQPCDMTMLYLLLECIGNNHGDTICTRQVASGCLQLYRGC